MRGYFNKLFCPNLRGKHDEYVPTKCLLLLRIGCVSPFILTISGRKSSPLPCEKSFPVFCRSTKRNERMKVRTKRKLQSASKLYNRRGGYIGGFIDWVGAKGKQTSLKFAERFMNLYVYLLLWKSFPPLGIEHSAEENASFCLPGSASTRIIFPGTDFLE